MNQLQKPGRREGDISSLGIILSQPCLEGFGGEAETSQTIRLGKLNHGILNYDE